MKPDICKRIRRPILQFLLALCCTGLAAPTISPAADWLKTGQDLLGGAAGSAARPQSPSLLSDSDIGAGLKDALRVGSERVVGQLGRSNGFNGDPKIRIPLPDTLQKVRTALTAVGKGAMLDDLELKLNRAAEMATPKAKALFWKSIEEMTLEDVQRIYNGPQDSATRYFQGKMTPPLAQAMRPVVDESLSNVGAIQSYDAVMGQYRALPFVPDLKSDLGGYVVEKGMDGIFYYLGQEEAAIRQNPAKRTTEILQKVFGSR